MKLAILDKDGTLTTTASGETFVQSPEDQVVLPGVAKKLIAMAADGWEFAIASNQGGVAAGHKTLQSAFDEVRYCIKLLPVKIREAFICPDFEGNRCFLIDEEGEYPMIEASIQMEGCRAGWRYDLTVDGVLPDEVIGKCRKSDKSDGAGMLRLAARHGADEVIMIGDRPEDKVSAKHFGCEFVDARFWRLG
jgi:D-glycero-D-manno-heptose 1,7-bisphosphate phosphatase